MSGMYCCFLVDCRLLCNKRLTYLALIIINLPNVTSSTTPQINLYLRHEGRSQPEKTGCTGSMRIAAMNDVAARRTREMGVRLGREVGWTVAQVKNRSFVRFTTKGCFDGA